FLVRQRQRGWLGQSLIFQRRRWGRGQCWRRDDRDVERLADGWFGRRSGFMASEEMAGAHESGASRQLNQRIGQWRVMRAHSLLLQRPADAWELVGAHRLA